MAFAHESICVFEASAEILANSGAVNLKADKVMAVLLESGVLASEFPRPLIVAAIVSVDNIETSL